MKNYTVIGLFPSQENAGEVSKSLELSGIRDQDYIIYKNTPAAPKAGFWKKLLGLEADAPANTVDKLITSVAARSEEELQKIKKSFEDNKVVKIYEFQDMTLEEAKNLNYVKKIVSLRAKSQIYAMPKTAISQKGFAEGMNAEVKI